MIFWLVFGNVVFLVCAFVFLRLKRMLLSYASGYRTAAVWQRNKSTHCLIIRCLCFCASFRTAMWNPFVWVWGWFAFVWMFVFCVWNGCCYPLLLDTAFLYDGWSGCCENRKSGSEKMTCGCEKSRIGVQDDDRISAVWPSGKNFVLQLPFTTFKKKLRFSEQKKWKSAFITDR